MKMLLINYEYPPFGGGAGNATQEISRALVKMGHTVTVLIAGKGVTYTDSMQILINPIGSFRKHHAQASMKEMFSFLFHGMVWAIKTRNTRFDSTIVFFALPCGPIATLLKKRWGTPYIVSLRGGDVPGLVPEIRVIHRFLTPFRRWVLRNSKAVVANAISLADLAQTADPVRVSVIPNGIDSERFQPGTRCTDDHLDVFRLLVVGRFHRQKRIPETIRCLAKAKQQGVKFLAVIVGDGPECDEILDTIRQEDLVEDITLMGWLEKDDVIRAYQSADCYLNLSSYEGMPNTILEAMSCGLPIIASDIPPHRALIRNGVTGALVDFDQPDKVVSWITRLAADKGQLKAMGAQARDHALRRYSWDAVANEYLSLLQHS